MARTSIQHSQEIDVPANGFLNIQRIVSAVMGEGRDQLFDDLNNVTAEFTVIEEEGALMIFTSSVDNGTADSIIRIE